MKTIILTGFEPFGDYAYNPTEKSARYFDGKAFGDRKVVGVVLPCIYNNWPRMHGLIRKHAPYAIINAGLASSARGFRIESRFRNIMNGKYPDNKGYDPKDMPIIPDIKAPGEISPRSSFRKLGGILEDAFIPTESSSDAGGFVCNSLGYYLSNAARMRYRPFKNLLVHIPWTTDYEDKVKITPEKMFLETELYYRGLELLIRNI